MKSRLCVIGAVVLFFVAVMVGSEGESRQAVGEQRMAFNSGSAWGDVLGFDASSSDRGAYESGEDMVSSGKQMQTIAKLSVAGAVGLLIAAWFVRRKRPEAATGPIKVESPRVDTTDIQRQPCPHCGELIAVSANICRFCQRDVRA